MQIRKNKLWLIDAGHGGMLPNGKYSTAPGKMFKHKDGTVIYEGVFNRRVQEKLAYLLQGAGIPYVKLTPENEDISLKERGARIDKYHKENGGNVCLVSLHGNAGKGTGFEAFTSKGQTESDLIADIFVEEMSKQFPAEKMRVDITDNDLDKEANFSILMNKGEAVLVEAFFMDNPKDAKLMMSEEGQSKIALAYFNAIKKCEAVAALEETKSNAKAAAAKAAEKKPVVNKKK